MPSLKIEPLMVGEMVATEPAPVRPSWQFIGVEKAKENRKLDPHVAEEVEEPSSRSTISEVLDLSKARCNLA